MLLGVMSTGPQHKTYDYKFITNMISEERKHDVAYLKSIYNKVSPEKRQEIHQTINKFHQESSKVRDMRKQLVRAMKEGKSENVKDINHWVQKHSEYK